jgi:hypothetical protein
MCPALAEQARPKLALPTSAEPPALAGRDRGRTGTAAIGPPLARTRVAALSRTEGYVHRKSIHDADFTKKSGD